jgi:hypothetical protein
MALDKLSPLAAPPGTGLTDEPGRWPWEKPPVYSDPDDAIDYLEEKISEEATEESMMKMLLAGITVEELVDQVAFKGFMAGFYSPDVAELIKPAVALILYDMALDNGIEPIMFVDREDAAGELDDAGFFRILKQRNPELFMQMNEEVNRQQRMQIDEITKQEPSAPAPQSESFLDVEENI